jgi:hypothetical protein
VLVQIEPVLVQIEPVQVQIEAEQVLGLVQQLAEQELEVPPRR